MNAEAVTLNFTIGGFGRGYERIIWQDNKLHHELFSHIYPEAQLHGHTLSIFNYFVRIVMLKKEVTFPLIFWKSYLKTQGKLPDGLLINRLPMILKKR